jgi:flavin-dependent dehydrogenase
LLAPVRLLEVQRAERGVRLRIQHEGRLFAIEARILIDAAGRSSSVLRSLGVRRHRHDRLICSYLYGQLVATHAKSIHTQADPDGWWYTAPLPDGRRVLAFHTDADLPVAIELRSSAALLERARRTPSLHALIADAEFACEPPALCAAHSSRLDAAAGEMWFAAGDAAMSFDPLSSQGLLQALYSGLAVAQAADRTLRGERDARSEYAREMERIYQRYALHASAWYGQEKRWAERPFWQRRS